jgi:hypothetical protein
MGESEDEGLFLRVVVGDFRGGGALLFWVVDFGEVEGSVFGVLAFAELTHVGVWAGLATGQVPALLYE